MGIIGRLLGSARRGTATGTAPTGRSGRTGRKGTSSATGTGRGGGLLSGVLRRKGR